MTLVLEDGTQALSGYLEISGLPVSREEVLTTSLNFRMAESIVGAKTASRIVPGFLVVNDGSYPVLANTFVTGLR